MLTTADVTSSPSRKWRGAPTKFAYSWALLRLKVKRLAIRITATLYNHDSSSFVKKVHATKGLVSLIDADLDRVGSLLGLKFTPKMFPKRTKLTMAMVYGCIAGVLVKYYNSFVLA